MAKCDVCGKDIAFGIKVSHSHRRANRTWKPNIRTREGDCKRQPQAYLRLHPLLAFRQGYPCRLKLNKEAERSPKGLLFRYNFIREAIKGC